MVGVPPHLTVLISLTQLTPEEEEKRRVRRERNKLAAAKCRNRRRELTDRLQAVRGTAGASRGCAGVGPLYLVLTEDSHLGPGGVAVHARADPYPLTSSCSPLPLNMSPHISSSQLKRTSWRRPFCLSWFRNNAFCRAMSPFSFFFF